ncbi:signal peptidase I [Nocardioides coralli]|uniref:signal peptidase I n=1 Tax=Nocardioides coralli TaxID=2872154 RepID=UPI001CA428EB|nr:signal peptidase I [Nocardioides coralli]QZY29831.1 signal peptidase I [Nocardioides coralli]
MSTRTQCPEPAEAVDTRAATARLRHVLTQVVSWCVLASVVVGAFALIVVPKATGSRPLTVLSGSMSGTYEIGDALIVRPVDAAELAVGDVITFQSVSDDPSLTTHRITAIAFGSEGRSFITKGDANGAVDPEPITEPQVMGKVWYSVPKVGYASVWMAGDWAQNAINALAGLLILYGLWHIGAGMLEKRRGEQPASPGDKVVEPSRAWHTGYMNRSYQGAFAASGVLAVAAVLIVIVGPPARAAASESPRLLVGSSAGGPFLDQLPSALFADAELVGPGDEVGDTFWVMNNALTDARVTVSVLEDEPDNELEAATSYELAVGGARTPDGPTDREADPCHTVATGPLLAPGEVLPVTVTARVGDLTGRSGMGQRASMDLRVSLTQATDVIEICGEEATEDPQPKSGQTGTDAPAVDAPVDCSRDVVVTTAGAPTCVPTVVAAGVNAGDAAVGGVSADDARPAAVAAGVAGGLLLLWARRRRHRSHRPRHRG